MFERVKRVLGIDTRKKIKNSGYSHHGASRFKKAFIGWISSSRDADEDILKNLSTLRERSRDLYMGAPIGASALKTLRTNVIGAGLKLKPAVDGEFLGLTDEETSELEKTIKREFKYWAESPNCDAMRRDNFYELQQLAFLSQIMSGDCFVLLPLIHRTNDINDLKILVLEADRVCDPPNVGTRDIKQGVECGKYGEVLAYHICNKHEYSEDYSKKIEWKRVKAYGSKTGRPNVLHLAESERPGQRRGVPLLAPVILELKQISRYTEAELMATVVSSFYTVFITNETNPLDAVTFNPSIPDGQRVDDKDPNSYELGNGSILELEPGQGVQEASPKRPVATFDMFMNAICKQIGAALEIPEDLLLKKFDASYSASRASLLEAWKAFKMRREWMVNDFCQPIYEEWFTEQVLSRRINAPGYLEDPLIRKAYTNAVWHGPAQGQLDPEKEVIAAQLRVMNGFSTRVRETVELTGEDWEDNIRHLAKEKVALDEVYIEQNLYSKNNKNSLGGEDDGLL